MVYTINAKVDKIHWLLVNQYTLKYSKIDDTTIHVSVPGYDENINIQDKKISNDFVDELRKCAWSDNAIFKLEQILFPNNGEWNKHMHKISIESGRLTKGF